MRPDVKLGVILSSVLVLVVGSYYMLSGGREAPVPIAGAAPSAQDASKVEPAGPAKPGVSPTRKPAAPTVGPFRRDSRLASREATGSSTGPNERPDTVPPASPSPVGSSPIRPAPVPVSSAAPSNTGGGSVGPATEKSAAAVDEGASPAAAGNARVASTDSPGATAPTTPPQPITLTATPQPSAAVPGPSAPVPASVAAAVETHRVQPGDTIATLAQRYYGDRGLARFLQDANPQITTPDALRPGDVVRIPSRPEELGASTTRAAGSTVRPSAPGARTDAGKPTTPAPKAAGQRTYVVKAGDSFYRIAKEQLGDSSRWREVFQMNKDRVGGDPTNLRVGQQILLPSK